MNCPFCESKHISIHCTARVALTPNPDLLRDNRSIMYLKDDGDIFIHCLKCEATLTDYFDFNPLTRELAIKKLMINNENIPEPITT